MKKETNITNLSSEQLTGSVKSSTNSNPELNKLLQTRESFLTIIENSLTGMYIIQSGQFRYVNTRMAEILGFESPSQLIGVKFWDLVHPDDREMVKARGLQRENEQVVPHNYQYRALKKDGSLIWVETSGSPASYMGQPANIGNIIDITDRKLAETALQESEKKHHTLLDDIEEGYFENDLKGITTYVNGSYCRIVGYKPEELIGQSYRKLAQDEASAETLFNDYNRIFKTGKPLKSQTYTFIIKDGSNKYVEITTSLIRDSQSKPIGFRGILHDVTDRKMAAEALAESEIKYRTILENMEDGYIEVDIDGNTTFFNDKMCQIFGYAREELIGLNHREYTDKRTADLVTQAFEHVFQSGQTEKGVTYEIIQKSGLHRMVETNVSQRKNQRGDCIGFKGIVRDITERVEADKERERYRSNLEAIFRSVKDAIITVDLDMNVIEANDAAQQICGLQLNQLIGKPLPSQMLTCQGHCFQVLRESLEKKEIVKEYRIECQHLVHPEQIVVATITPLLDKEEQFAGAVLVLRDITRLSDLEKELIDRHQFHNIIGQSPRMQEIFKLLEILANTETTVIVTGESGTGKELVTKAIHYSGHRALKPLIAVNCSALAENLLESELFGHVKGAFTGALKNKIGRFQAADQGTILLDEIGDISPRIQLKLLRVLEEKEFERVGESLPIKVDVRVIACTNKVLSEKVRLGEFREDLYYRLKVMEIKLPPLRDRLEDIPILVDHFTSLFNQKYNKNVSRISDSVLQMFMDYGWPGNIRELEHALEHAFVLCEQGIILPDQLPSELKGLPLRKRAANTDPSVGPQEILGVLEKTDWNKAKAARLLGINRKTLYRKLSKFNLSSPQRTV
jgi:two-component system, NtrC family, response regulator HydG